MKKIIIPLLTAVLLLACTVSTIPAIVPAKTPVPSNGVSAQPTPTAVKTEIPFEFTESPQVGTPIGSSITVVELHRSGGPLPDQLVAHTMVAAGLDQAPIVYFTAEW